MATTGDRIREIREEKHMTQEQLAKDAKISKGFISDVENNKRNIGSEGLLRIANVLGASLDYLLRGETVADRLDEKVIIPGELSQAAEELQISYSKTLEILNAHKSVLARRSTKSIKPFDVDDWKKLYKAIEEVFK